MTEAGAILTTIVVGLGATVLMDLWAMFMKTAFGVAAANYCLVGRWVCHMTRGVFVHASIARADRRPFECAVGWVVHYLVGAGYALVFVAIVSTDWLNHPTVLPALLFGVGTVLVPFLVMQPSFGLGFAASRSPDPAAARLRSLMAHAAFGAGLYISAAAMHFVITGTAKSPAIS